MAIWCSVHTAIFPWSALSILMFSKYWFIKQTYPNLLFRTKTLRQMNLFKNTFILLETYSCWTNCQLNLPFYPLQHSSRVVRKSIARVLTVINQTQKENLRKFYKVSPITFRSSTWAVHTNQSTCCEGALVLWSKMIFVELMFCWCIYNCLPKDWDFMTLWPIFLKIKGCVLSAISNI